MELKKCALGSVNWEIKLGEFVLGYPCLSRRFTRAMQIYAQNYPERNFHFRPRIGDDIQVDVNGKYFDAKVEDAKDWR